MMKRFAPSAHLLRTLTALCLAAALVVVSAFAAGAVRQQGVWPAVDKNISLEARGLPRSQAIEKLAEAAGWSVVLHAPPGDTVDLHVKAQPAVKVLEMLLTDGDYVADRHGDLISITREVRAAAPAAESASASLAAPGPAEQDPAPEATPEASEEQSSQAAPERGEDRVMTGGNLRIEKGESVHDVVMFGGSVDVYGTVTGDVVVTGGSVRLHDGARIDGDVTALGGSIDVAAGAEVRGDVGVVGGVLRRAEGARIGGDVKQVGGKKKKGSSHVSVSSDSEAAHADKGGVSVGKVAGGVGGALTRAALLFVFGAVFLALTPRRTEQLQGEIAARPMRAFALGVVGSLLAALLMLAMVVTVIGLPFALIGALLIVIAVYVGICMVLSTVGGAVIGHRTRNPYLHLALGCALLLVVGSIPYVGGAVTAAVVLVGLGAVVATRGAGLWPAAASPASAHPYR
jgi:cytoskeletal protein CcmA (bactofilin family)